MDMAKGRWLKIRLDPNRNNLMMKDFNGQKCNVSIDKCPKCGEDGIAFCKWVWNGGHANGRFYVYYKHQDQSEHYGRPLNEKDPLHTFYGYAGKYDIDFLQRLLKDAEDFISHMDNLQIVF